jgi:1,4-alpha-glucan branching enzyme
MMSHMAIVGSAGTYPVDYTQGFPGGRFVSFAFRFSVQPHMAGRNELSVRVPRTDTTIVRFLVTTVRERQRLIRVFAPTAHRVELNGDFTAWQSVPLVRNPDGWWSVVLSIPAGSYQVNLRVDQKRWVVPPGLPRVTDEFGGAAGIIVVQ